MGAYLYTGIINKVEVESIDNLGNYNFLPLDLYNVEVGDRCTTLTLKNTVLTKENLLDFLEEQYSKFSVYNKEEIYSNIRNIKDTENFMESLRDINHEYFLIIDEIWAGLTVEMICYISDGKFNMESYHNTLNYCLDAIRKSSDNPLIKTVDFLIC